MNPFSFTRCPSLNLLITIWLSWDDYLLLHLRLCNSGSGDPTPVPGMGTWRKPDQSEYEPYWIWGLVQGKLHDQKSGQSKPIRLNLVIFVGTFEMEGCSGGVAEQLVIWNPRATDSNHAIMGRQSPESGVYLGGKQKRHGKSKTSFWWNCLSPTLSLAWVCLWTFQLFDQ